jgi:UDP-N-acetylglucosamine acyltransferase
MFIHPTAIISKKAQIASDVEIGAYAVIEDDVKIARRVKILSYAHILNQTSIDEDCQIHMGAILGHLPQMRQTPGPPGRLIIGRRNIFREYTTIHRSTKKEAATIIGNDNYFMGFSHIAHDCSIGNYVTICNGTLIAGHVGIGDYAFISGNVTVHQFCRIGRYAMVGGLTRVAKDVPPYMLVKGDSSVWAVNSVGLKRANFSAQMRSQIKNAFKILYKSRLNTRQAIERLQQQSNTEEIKYLIDFILQSKRGICAYKRPGIWERVCSSRLINSHRQIPAYQLFQRNRSAQHPCLK